MEKEKCICQEGQLKNNTSIYHYTEETFFSLNHIKSFVSFLILQGRHSGSIFHKPCKISKSVDLPEIHTANRLCYFNNTMYLTFIKVNPHSIHLGRTPSSSATLACHCHLGMFTFPFIESLLVGKQRWVCQSIVPGIPP